MHALVGWIKIGLLALGGALAVMAFVLLLLVLSVVATGDLPPIP